MTKNKLIIILSIIFLSSTLFISMGYSAFEKTFNIDESIAHVRVSKDVRITDFKVDGVYNDALAEGEEFDYNLANVDLLIPKEGGYVSYNVTITNLGNTEAKLSSVKVIGENAAWLEAEVVDFELGSVITDNDDACITSENGCKLGISRTINIRIKNKPGVFYNYYHYRNVYIEFQFGTEEAIQIGDNILNQDNVSPNSYIERNGVETAFSGWTSSEYIDVSNYRELILVSNGTMLGTWNACYDENKNFISAFTPQNMYLYNEQLGNISASIAFHKITNECKYIRVSDKSQVISTLRIYPLMNENYNNNFKFIYNVVSSDEFIYGENHMNADEIEPNTYISNTNGTIIPYNGWYSTGYIDIHNLDEYIVSSPISFAPNQYSAYYDENYNYISRAPLPSVKMDANNNYYTIGTRPENAYYVRFSEASGSRAYYSMNVSSYAIKTYNADLSLSENFVLGENIFDSSNIVENKYIEQNGTIYDYNAWGYTDYYPVGNGLFISSSVGVYNALYGADYSYSSGFSCSGITVKNEYIGDVLLNLCYVRPSQKNKYIRLSNNLSTLRNFKIYPILNDDFNYIFEFELR